jgi:TolB-like protein/DNA-binding winged helix-turn-helix (wHTH) protein/Tfp pilus assembly protein PilF
MQRLSHQTRCFDGFTLDLTRGCLLRGNQEIKLPPKPYDALKYLVENPGRLISKRELIEALWPDTAVTDDSLVQCMKEVRRALGDDAQQIIKTVPRRGYIFEREVRENAPSAPVTTYAEESGVQLIIEEEETDGQRMLAATELSSASVPFLPAYKPTSVQRLTSSIKQHKWIAAGTLATLAVVATAFVYFTRPGEAIDSIAVMPFVNVNGDPNIDYLSEGISDNIIDRLSRLPNLKRVIPLNSVLRYKGKQTDPQAVGRELGVRALLMGRLIQHGDELSISVELIDVRDNKHLWSGQYPGKSAELMNVQAEIAQDVSNKLRLRLSGEQQKQLTRTYSQSGEANRLFMQGRYFQRRGKKENIEKSIEYYGQAVEKDPTFALAYAELGLAYRRLGWSGWMAPKEFAPQEELNALKALRIDDALAEAHVVMADIKAFHLDWQGAEAEYQRALELDPNSARTHQFYAAHLRLLGRLDESMLHMKRAQEVDPLSFEIDQEIAQTLYWSRQYDRAIEEFQKTAGIDANFPHGLLAQAYQAKGRYQEAVVELEKAGGKGNHQLGYAYAVAGKTTEARRVLDELNELSKDRYVSPFRFALVYIGLGDKDQAFAWLNKAFDEDPYRLAVLKANPRFDSLRADPRCTDLLRRMKLAS